MKAPSRLMRLFPHSDSGSDLEAEDARRKWINVYDGFDKARDKVNPHVKPGSTFFKNSPKKRP
jgi:hypothetical protein